jgi:hypothetical protein
MATKSIPIYVIEYSKHVIKYIPSDDTEEICKILQIDIIKRIRKFYFFPDSMLLNS